MKLIIKLIFLVSFTSFSQVGGTSVYNFLNVPTSARQAALGGKVITLLDDINQPLWNPSTINAELDNKLAYIQKQTHLLLISSPLMLF